MSSWYRRSISAILSYSSPMALPSPSSVCETVSRLKEGESSTGGLEGVDAVDDHPAGHGREQVALLARMGAPFNGPPLPPQKELRPALVGCLLKHSQVELDDVPADDDVRVVSLEPVVELSIMALRVGQ